MTGLLLGLAGWVRRAPSAALARASGEPVTGAVPGQEASLESSGRELAIQPSPILAEEADAGHAGAAPLARDFLAAYYGARWAEVEAAIAGAGVDLDQPYHFTPWEDVALEFERAMPLDEARREAVRDSLREWPAELTLDWVREAYPAGVPYALSEADLPELEVLAAAKNGELDLLSDEWAQRIDFHLRERWQTGRYLRAPFTTMGLSTEVGFYSCSHGGYGWAVTLTLRREDYPDMVLLEEEAARVRHERDVLVLVFLRNRALR